MAVYGIILVMYIITACTYCVPDPDPIRLVGGRNRCEGRVELYHANRWGTVCDGNWDMNAAMVVCRQLNCGKALAAPAHTQFGPGSDPTWISNVKCTGTESILGQCPHSGFGKQNCKDHEDAGVVCEESVHPLVPELQCNRTVMRIVLPAVHNVHDTNSGHLADPSCNTKGQADGTVWYEVQRRADVCGNVLKVNGTHAIFSNTLFLYPVNVNGFSLPTGFPFSCVYSLNSQASIDIEIRPYLILDMAVIGVGPSAYATMFLYRNPDFTDAYPSGSVDLPVGTPLYVGINVEEVEANHFAVIIEDCYITGTRNADDPNKYQLIQNGCPINQRVVTLVENGTSLRARFTALLFLYHGNYNSMFLHCHLSLCDRTTNSCSTRCQSRTARSVSNLTVSKSLTVGPINWTKEEQ